MQSRSLSPVQQYAVQILVALEERQRNENYINAFKIALVTANPSTAKSLFPDLLPDDEEEEIVVEMEDLDLDKIEGEVRFEPDEGEAMTPAKMRDILSQFS